MTATVQIIYSEVRISVHRLRKTIKILIGKNDTSQDSNLAPPTYKLRFYCYTGNFYFGSYVNTAIIQMTWSALQPSVTISHSQLKMPMPPQLQYHLF